MMTVFGAVFVGLLTDAVPPGDSSSKYIVFVADHPPFENPGPPEKATDPPVRAVTMEEPPVLIALIVGCAPLLPALLHRGRRRLFGI